MTTQDESRKPGSELDKPITVADAVKVVVDDERRRAEQQREKDRKSLTTGLGRVVRKAEELANDASKPPHVRVSRLNSAYDDLEGRRPRNEVTQTEERELPAREDSEEPQLTDEIAIRFLAERHGLDHGQIVGINNIIAGRLKMLDSGRPEVVDREHEKLAEVTAECDTLTSILARIGTVVGENRIHGTGVTNAEFGDSVTVKVEAMVDRLKELEADLEATEKDWIDLGQELGIPEPKTDAEKEAFQPKIFRAVKELRDAAQRSPQGAPEPPPVPPSGSNPPSDDTSPSHGGSRRRSRRDFVMGRGNDQQEEETRQ